MADSDISLNRGLQGIYLDRTNTTFIDGKEGVLEYSGYNIHDLAENSTFEETSYLLMYGSLPNKSQLLEFKLLTTLLILSKILIQWMS